MEWIITAIVAFVIWRIFRRRTRRADAEYLEGHVTPYDGTDAWKAETGHFPPTEKQLDFIEDLYDQVDYLSDSLGTRVRVPRVPKNLNRAKASELIDRLIELRDELEEL